jgi:hypothetical protein
LILVATCAELVEVSGLVSHTSISLLRAKHFLVGIIRAAF